MKIVDNFLSEEVYKNFVDALQNERLLWSFLVMKKIIKD